MLHLIVVSLLFTGINAYVNLLPVHPHKKYIDTIAITTSINACVRNCNCRTDMNDISILIHPTQQGYLIKDTQKKIKNNNKKKISIEDNITPKMFIEIAILMFILCYVSGIMLIVYLMDQSIINNNSKKKLINKNVIKNNVLKNNALKNNALKNALKKVTFKKDKKAVPFNHCVAKRMLEQIDNKWLSNNDIVQTKKMISGIAPEAKRRKISKHKPVTNYVKYKIDILKNIAYLQPITRGIKEHFDIKYKSILIPIRRKCLEQLKEKNKIQYKIKCIVKNHKLIVNEINEKIKVYPDIIILKNQYNLHKELLEYSKLFIDNNPKEITPTLNNQQNTRTNETSIFVLW